MRNAALPLASHLACALAVACDPVQPDRPGGSGADLTVTQIQNVADPAYPGVGARVALHDVLVIAVDTYDEDGAGRVGNVWVAEPAVGADVGCKAGCHSDVVDSTTAQRVHEEKLDAKLVQVRVKPLDAPPAE